MATAASTFQQQWKPGRRVAEIAPPHRRGTVRAVTGTGAYAVIAVNLDGRPPQNFRPAQLALL
jgi:hypothetical protein